MPLLSIRPDTVAFGWRGAFVLQWKRLCPQQDPDISCQLIITKCFGWCALSLCGLQAFLQCQSRNKIRNRFHIDGNLCTDLLAACCCTCCQLVQADKEVINRMSEQTPLTGGPGYQPQQPMQYAPGQKQHV